MRRYGKWAASPKGTPEDVDLCVVSVIESWGWLPRQCLRKRGHGPDGLYCKQHAKMLAAGEWVSVPEDIGE